MAVHDHPILGNRHSLYLKGYFCHVHAHRQRAVFIVLTQAKKPTKGLVDLLQG